MIKNNNVETLLPPQEDLRTLQGIIDTRLSGTATLDLSDQQAQLPLGCCTGGFIANESYSKTSRLPMMRQTSSHQGL
ncbi:hypothetical protein DXG01_005476 [Tephrocybe rancida]|nr:hypothetical protein DXG01_005476 [Tephrocybe rancida]